MKRMIGMLIISSSIIAQTDVYEVRLNTHFALQRLKSPGATHKTQVQAAGTLLELNKKIEPNDRAFFEDKLRKNNISIATLEKKHTAGMYYTTLHHLATSYKEAFIPELQEQRMYELSKKITALDPGWSPHIKKLLQHNNLTIRKIRNSYIRAVVSHKKATKIEERIERLKKEKPALEQPPSRPNKIDVLKPAALEKLQEKYNIKKSKPASQPTKQLTEPKKTIETRKIMPAKKTDMRIQESHPKKNELASTAK